MKIDTLKNDYQDFGDEIVFVNIESGAYYTLKGFVLNIIRIVEKGFNDGDLTVWLEKNCTDLQELEKVKSIIRELRQDSILIDSNIEKNEEDFRPDFTLGTSEFKKFDDMRDLIKLDPIHEVDSLGWPHKKK